MNTTQKRLHAVPTDAALPREVVTIYEPEWNAGATPAQHGDAVVHFAAQAGLDPAATDDYLRRMGQRVATHDTVAIPEGLVWVATTMRGAEIVDQEILDAPPTGEWEVAEGLRIVVRAGYVNGGDSLAEPSPTPAVADPLVALREAYESARQMAEGERGFGYGRPEAADELLEALGRFLGVPA